MTREEIRKNYSLDDGNLNPVEDSCILNLIDSAMSDYAKQEAIEFLIWKDNQRWVFSDISKNWFRVKNNKYEFISGEDLFDEYLKNKIV